jgi:CPA2 family monovalent cation:H+ antiporter-2
MFTPTLDEAPCTRHSNGRMTAHAFLETLAIVLGIAGITTVISRKLGLSTVLGYLIAGLIVGPYVPIPLAADHGIVRTLSEIGVILLMLSIGLELSVRKVLRLAPLAGPIAAVEMGVMGVLGYMVARAFGWTSLDAAFAGAMVAVSSTMVIAKAFATEGLRGRFVDLTFGVLVFEDLVAVLLVTVLGALAAGMSPSAQSLLVTTGGLLGFFVGVVVLGLPIVPRLFRAIVRDGSAETTTVAVVGLCFALSLLASAVGYSVALGAFLAGVLVAESGESAAIERLVEPIRDLFSAIFFVSVGMLIEPSLVLEHWGAILAFAAVVIVGKVLAVTAGALLAGEPVARAARIGLSLAQIGEFSFVIVGVGVNAGVVNPALMPVAVMVSAVTAFTTPVLVRHSEAFGRALEARLPGPLRSFAALYHARLVRLRQRTVRPNRAAARAHLRRAVLDALGMVALAVGAGLSAEWGASYVRQYVPLPNWALRSGLGLLASVLAIPFAVGLIRNARALALHWVADLDLAPPTERFSGLSRALQDGFTLAITMAFVLPVAAIVIPLLPLGTSAALVLVVVAIVMSFAGRVRMAVRSIRAGSDVLLEGLGSQLRAPELETSGASQPGSDLVATSTSFTGALGTLEPVTLVEVASGWAIVGQPLSALALEDLESVTLVAGVTHRDGGTFGIGDEPLSVGDRLLFAGPPAALIEVRRRLVGL